MKKVLLLLLLLLMMLIPNMAKAASSSDNQEIVQNQISQYQGTLDNLGIGQTVSDISSGKFSLNPMDIAKGFWDMLVGQLQSNIWLIIQLIILGILVAVLNALQTAFGKKGVSEIAFFACYAIIAAVGVKVFIGTSGDAQGFIRTSGAFINTIIPLLLILLATSGGIISSTFLSPAILISTELITYLITNIFLPLTFTVIALSIANNLSERLNISGLINIIKNIIKWGLGLALTIFVGLTSVYALFTPTLDARTIALGEYSVKTFIPVVGSILSDTVGLVSACSSVVKSSVGVAGLIGFALIAIVPIVKMLAQIGALKLAGSILEPIVDNRITRCLSEIGGGMTLVMIMMIVISVMFFVNVAIIIKIGGNSGFY